MKQILFVTIAFFAFASSGMVAHLYNREDNYSLRYVLWKKGLHPYPSDIIYFALLSDYGRSEVVRGKTKDEIRRMFHDVREKRDYIFERHYENELKGRDYLWLGDVGVIIFFKDGVADELSNMKG